MRFTLKQLLLIFPAYVVTFVVYWFLWVGVSHPNDIGRVQDALRTTRYSKQFIDDAEKDRGRQFPDDAIAGWLAGENDLAGLSPFQDLAECRVDPWGHSYRFVRRLSDAAGGSIGVYSVGEDGVSLTEGNDSDDVNSWNPASRSYYFDRAAQQQRQEAAVTAIFFTPLVWAGMLGIASLYQSDEAAAASESLSSAATP